jgi:hypothetical protein
MSALSARAAEIAQWLLIGIASAALAVHGAGWVAAGTVAWQKATFHIPRSPSLVTLALSMLVLRAAAAPRRARRLVVVSALAAAGVAFFVVSLPERFEGNPLWADLPQAREDFEIRFSVPSGTVNFHSHLGDMVMTGLYRAFGRSTDAPTRAHWAMSRIAGLLFLFELAMVAAWHGWSRRVCRFVALALATPLCLLYFGSWGLGYLAIAVGVVPLLAIARGRNAVSAEGATIGAGFLQGIHTALHGFGMLGVAGGALAALAVRGNAVRRLLRTASFTLSAVALYLGWIFLYITVAGLSLRWSRQLNSRPVFEAALFEHQIASPLLSRDGLAELGFFSVLSGVPILALAMLSAARSPVIPAVLYALPGLLYLVRWWPVTAPYNLDLMLAVFPGLFAACWVVASRHRTAMVAFAMLVGVHALLWTMVGGGLFTRVSVNPPP